jgi:hypothetical protein
MLTITVIALIGGYSHGGLPTVFRALGLLSLFMALHVGFVPLYEYAEPGSGELSVDQRQL